jgi:non-ribosomal peptide synthetase-like protein
MAFVDVASTGVAVSSSSPPRILHRHFERQAERVPDRVAVECVKGSRTYDELNRAANRIAHALEKCGVETGMLVGILLDKSPDLYAAMLGALKAGAGYVPLDPKFPTDRMSAILEDSGAAVVITDAAGAERFGDSITTRFLLLDADKPLLDALPDTPIPAHRVGVQPNDPCYVIYTSGSTGRPKGVMIEHRNASAFIEGMLEAYGVDDSERIYQGFSAAFDASVEEIWLAFSQGATLVVPPQDVSRSPADAAEFIRSRGVTYFSTIPTFLSMIDQELPTVSTIVVGGEACSPELVARWAQPWRRLLNTYGPTEATVVATLAECVPGQPVTIGVPLPGYRVHVLDEEMELVPAGSEGELYIGGPAIARGYMNSQEMTDERFISLPEIDSGRLYRTGDQVRLLANGELQFIGRIDGQIKIRGFRVELSEIEAVLQQQPGVRAAGVKVAQTEQGMELAAFIVIDGNAPDAGALAEELGRLLPEYMVPKYLDIVGDIPLSNSGKIDRKALPEPQTLLKRARGNVVMPADELETGIAAAWQQALGIPDISVTDDFFMDLHGHSLLAARTITALRARFAEAALSVRDLYRHPTVRALAAELRARGVDVGSSTVAADDDAITPSELAFAGVGWFTRTTVSWLQGLSVVAYYALVSAPITFGILTVAAVYDGRIGWSDAAFLATVFGFAYWPAMVALTIAIKWLVIGRYRAGRYPVWGFYYFRWWLVTRFQALAWADMFSGTPLMSLYYRAMGARVGRHVTLSTPHCLAFDVVSIGRGASVGTETQLLGCRVEDGMLHIAPVEIGRNCFVGMHCNFGLGTKMGDGARLEDMSALTDWTELCAGGMAAGAPAQPANVRAPGDQLTPPPRFGRTFVFGLLHLGLIYAMGYFLLATIAPSLVLIMAALYFGGGGWAIAAALLSVPLSVATYLGGVVAVKRYVVGQLNSGTIRQHSFAYLKHWFAKYLMENTRHIMMPLYATVYLPAFLRQLGAKIGEGSEISTVSHICPDHLEVGDGSFLADACLVGGHRVHGGYVQTAPVSIGSKTFIGNSALLAGGSIVGDDVLIGVSSTPPSGTKVPDGTAWLGSPSFKLPHRQKDCCFPEATTFAPTQSMRRQRATIDAIRVIGPGLIVMANLIVYAVALLTAWHNLPLWGMLLAIPAINAAVSFNAILVVALIKKACLGSLEPTVRPLWSRFVWLNELVNAIYEGVAASVMTPLLGTRMAAPALRMMGCKVGKWVFIDTTLFSEFDLVHIDDYAALNLGATIQTHLFEDRVFKADTLRIARGCSVGNMAVVLYDTQMHAGAKLCPLSVLMKGEVLPAGSVWAGVPCEQINTRPRVVEQQTPPPIPVAVPRMTHVELPAAA